MIDLSVRPTLADIQNRLPFAFSQATRSSNLLRNRWDPADGTPVYTVGGKYTSRGWTEWTQGFQFGNAIYLYDATDNEELLTYGRNATVNHMATHVSHTGVHDHGFNNVSTYGNLLRLLAEGRIPRNEWEAETYRLALKTSAAVQASRWTDIADGLGFIHSFNGSHSLFSDTVRTLRILAIGHQLGHVLTGEQDTRISLLGRLLLHAETTSRYNVYFGTGRDRYDVRGRVVHESIFNVKNGSYRCPSTQQGYSPFSTWTRGHAWILLGYPELLEWLRTLEPKGIQDAVAMNLEIGATSQIFSDSEPYALFPSAYSVEGRFLSTACAVADFFIEYMPTDGIPYWDTGAPGLAQMGDYLEKPADPFNTYEPVDSSAAAISAQGLLRLGRYLRSNAERLAREGIIQSGNGWDDAPIGSEEIRKLGDRYYDAGLVTSSTLLSEPYLNTNPDHEGILLHSVYHRPNGWDHEPGPNRVPHGESCMWGDYHFIELSVYLQRLTAREETENSGREKPYLTFFGIDS